MVYSQSLSSNSSDFFPCIFLKEKELIYASEKTKQYYEEQVNFFLREAQFLARNVLAKKQNLLEKIAHQLIEKKYLNRDALEEILHEASKTNTSRLRIKSCWKLKKQGVREDEK